MLTNITNRLTPDGVIQFKNDANIKIYLQNSTSYRHTRTYDKNVAQNNLRWSQVIIHHNGKYKSRDIIPALFQMVGDEEEFYPVGYCEGSQSDNFIIRKCMSAINKLFEKNLNLYIKREDDSPDKIPLTVIFNIADFEIGQIVPSTKLDKLIHLLFSRLETEGKITNVLNLSVLFHYEEAHDIVFDFGNKKSFELLCKLILNSENFFKINGIIFKNIKIRHLAPITAFDKCNFKLFDLSCNQIKSFEQLSYLKNIEIDHLHLAKNPITTDPKYVLKIRQLFPKLQKLDGVFLSDLVSGSLSNFNRNVTMENEGILINNNAEVNINNFKNSKSWHKIIIKNKGAYTKEEILLAVFSAMNPDLTPFYPCFYEVGNFDDCFLIRNSFEQLKYISKNLSIVIPGTTNTLNLELRMNVSKIKDSDLDPHHFITNTASIRYNIIDKTLDLSAFCSSKEMDKVSITFAYGKFLNLILRECSFKFMNNIMTINLSKNNIKTTLGLHYLTKMNKLKLVDLGYNKIENLKDLAGLCSETLQELVLNYNPICEKYSKPNKYVEDLRNYFPKLIKLDNVSIVNDSYLYQKNYICSSQSYDFVEKFVQMYFSAYDSPYRSQLSDDMYHPKALFSISYYDSRKNNTAAKFKLYKNLSRNMLLTEAWRENWKHVYSGNIEIKKVLETLPQTVHDFLSFNVDTLIFTSERIIITVTGVFKESVVDFAENVSLFSFSRNFAISPVLSNLRSLESGTKYQITNEQLYVTNVTRSQYTNAFKHKKPLENTSLIAETPDEKEKFIVMLQEITRLKSAWCTRCLERGQWNFRRAVQVFIDMSETDEIPNNAFLPAI